MRPAALRGRVLGVPGLCLALAACGQKGPPLAPLRLVPDAVSDVSLRRVGDRAELRFTLPSKNANGPGPIDLERVEIYAMTVPPGVTPPNRDLLAPANVVGRIDVRPPAVEGEPPPEPDGRPGPGDAVSFAEDLTPGKLTPVAIAEPAKAAAGEPAAAAAAEPAAAQKPAAAAAAEPAAAQKPAAAATAEPAAPQNPTEAAAAEPAAAQKPTATAAAEPAAAQKPTDPVRVYVARGVTRSGRFGPPSQRQQLPVVPVPPPPAEVRARFTETAVIVEWTPHADAPSAAFNVYPDDEPLTALNAAPLSEAPFEQPGAAFGEERCYRVRSVATAGGVAIESEPSERACVTPRDVFPPPAPTGLAAVPTPGQVSLIWDANAGQDVAGYVVLRGEPGGALQPITPEPIRETSYRDTGVTPGVRYVYAVVAVDAADPPNASPPSERVEETAR